MAQGSCFSYLSLEGFGVFGGRLVGCLLLYGLSGLRVPGFVFLDGSFGNLAGLFAA